MTAHAVAGEADKSRDAGMDDHMTKTIDPPAYVATLAKWIAPRPGIGASFKGSKVPSPMPVDDPLPADLRGIDLGDGLTRLGGNRSLYRAVLAAFASDFAGAPDVID